MRTRIEIFNINGLQPDGFKDAVISVREPIFLGFQETKIETEKPLRLRDDSQYLIRPIQEIFYPKYKIQFIVNAEYWIEQIKYARKVQVYQENERTHDGWCIDFTREFITHDTYKCEYTYFDRGNENIADNLKHEFLVESSQTFNYYDFHYGSNSSEYLRTRIEPLEISPEPEQTTYNANDRKFLTKTVLRKTKTLTFYCGQEKVKDFTSKYHFFNCYVDGLGFMADVLPNPTITELAGSDLFKIEIDFIYNVQNVYIS